MMTHLSDSVAAVLTEQIALFDLPALPHHPPALRSIDGGRRELDLNQLRLFAASAAAPPPSSAASLRAVPGGRACPTSRDRAALSKNEAFCEDCAAVCNLKPVAGKLSAWSEIEVCDIRTRRLRTAYFCEFCTEKLWENAA